MFINGDIYMDESELDNLREKLNVIAETGVISDDNDIEAICDAIDLIADITNIRY